MSELRRQPSESRFTVEGKQEREKSIASVVYDALSKGWGTNTWDDVSYKQMEAMFRAVHDHSTKELGVLEMPHKVEAEYKRQLINTLVDQISVVMRNVDEDDLVEVYEHAAIAIPDAASDILKRSLHALKGTVREKTDRFHLARVLVEKNPRAFLELSELGISELQQIELARGLAGKEGLTIFAFVESVGGTVTDAFARGVIKQIPGEFAACAEFLRLSPAEIQEMLRETPVDSKTEMKAGLPIPVKPEKKSAFDFVRRNRFETQHPIDIERLSKFGDAIHDAVEKDYPEQREAQRVRREREQMLRGPIETIGELGGDSLNAPLICYFEGQPDAPAIYKPQRREGVADLLDIPAGTYAKREWLAYQIDQALQISTIPTMVLRDGPEGVGSVKEWVIARTAATTKDWQTQAKQDQLEDLVFDDVVKGNQDGHDENFVIGHDGSVWGIDFGMILSTEPDPYIESAPGHAYSMKKPSKRVVDRIQRFQDSKHVQSALFNCFHAALGNNFDIAWERFQTQLHELAPTSKDGRYPWMGLSSIEDQEAA